MDQYWIVARAQAGRELWAAENIHRKGHEYFIPMIGKRVRGTQRQYELVPTPMFPTYVFVKSETWYWLLSTFGIKSVIMRGEKPDRLSDRHMRQMFDARGPDGLINLPEVTNVNTKARITQGPFRGHVGIVQGMTNKERVRILLDVLGGRTEVLIQSQQLQAVA